MKLRLSLLAVVLAAGMAQPAVARDLTIISWGGAVSDGQREAFFAPFAAETGIKVVDDAWNGGVGAIRARVEAGGDPGWDVVQGEAEEVQIGCAEGLYEPIDWSKIKEKDRLIPEGVSKCGVGSMVWSAGIGYDKDRLNPAPTSVADFFDTKRFPGKRAIRKGPKYALEIALMADGVPVDKVYETLRTPEGVDRAFAKLQTIKPDLLFFESGGQAMQLLASGEATMVMAFNGRITAANKSDKRNFRFIWPGSIYAVELLGDLAQQPEQGGRDEIRRLRGAGPAAKDPAAQSRLWADQQGRNERAARGDRVRAPDLSEEPRGRPQPRFEVLDRQHPAADRTLQPLCQSVAATALSDPARPGTAPDVFQSGGQSVQAGRHADRSEAKHRLM